MSIYSGVNIIDCRSPPLPLCCYNGHLYLEYAEIIREKSRTKGLRLHLFTEGNCNKQMFFEMVIALNMFLFTIIRGAFKK